MSATVYTAEQVPGQSLVNHLSFDGSDDGLAIGTGANTNLALNTQSSLKIAAWVRFGSSKDDHILAKVGNAANGWAFAWTRDTDDDNTNTGRLFLRMDDGSSALAGTIYADIDLDDGEWHLLEVIWNGASGTILLDGVDQSASTSGTINAAFDANLTATAVVGCDSGNSVADNSGFGAFSSGSDFGEFDVRWMRFQTHNGTGWVTQMEFHFDEGTGTPASEIANGSTSLIDSPAWTSDFAGPLGLTATERAGYVEINCSRWWGWREMGGDSQIRYEFQRATDSGFTTDLETLTSKLPSISDTDLWITAEEGQYIELTSPSGTFEVGETITGGTSGATGVVRFHDTSGAFERVYFHTRNGNLFVGGEAISANVSGASGTVRGAGQNFVQYATIPPLGEDANSATKNGSASNYGYGYERFFDRDVVADTYYYRVRIKQYDASGTLTRTGEWSQSASVAYAGTRGAVLPASPSSYNPPQLSAARRIGILLSIGQTATGDDDVTYNGLNSNALDGPSAWATLLDTWLGYVPNSFIFISKPFGNNKGYADDGASTGTSSSVSTDTVPFPNGRFPATDEPNGETRGYFATTSIEHPETLYERGAQLVNGDGPDSFTDATAGGQMQDIVDDFITELAGYATTQGVPTICYWRCPWAEGSTLDSDVLAASLGVRLPLTCGMMLGFDTFSSSGIYDQSFGAANQLSAAGEFAEWWDANYGAYAVWAEPGLFRERAQHWLDSDYDWYNTINLVEDVFDETDNMDGTVTLSVKTSPIAAIDPADYPDRKHIFLISTSGSAYVNSNSGTNEDQMNAIMEVARKIVAYAPNCYAVIGSHTFVINNITDAQKAELIALSDEGQNYMRTRTMRTTRTFRTERMLT